MMITRKPIHRWSIGAAIDLVNTIDFIIVALLFFVVVNLSHASGSSIFKSALSTGSMSFTFRTYLPPISSRKLNAGPFETVDSYSTLLYRTHCNIWAHILRDEANKERHDFEAVEHVRHPRSPSSFILHRPELLFNSTLSFNQLFQSLLLQSLQRDATQISPFDLELEAVALQQ